MEPGAFAAYCRTRGLSPTAIAAVDSVRSSTPSRRVGRRAGNVAGRFASPSMGWVIQAESRTVEWQWIYAMEYARRVRPAWGAVLEYWDQPPPISLRYRAKSGRLVGPVRSTPDFFILAEHFTGWVECKPEQVLRERAVAQPHRYVCGPDGRWRCPPGDAYAAEVGLAFDVLSSADLDQQVVRNLRWLEEYFRCGGYRPTVAAEAAVLAVVDHQPGLTLTDLLARVEGAGPDEVYALVVRGALYVDLSAAPLAEPARVQVFRSAALAEACAIRTQTGVDALGEGPCLARIARGEQVSFDGVPWTIVNLGQHHVTLLPVDEAGAATAPAVDLPQALFQSYLDKGRIVSSAASVPVAADAGATARVLAASEADLAMANRRWQCIAPHLTQGVPVPVDGPVPARTLYAWMARYRQADRRHGDGYLGLLPPRRQGNRTPRYSAKAYALLRSVFDEQYAVLGGRRTKASVYVTYLAR
jgi:putative transposase